MSLISGKRRLLCRIGDNGVGSIVKYSENGIFRHLFPNPFPNTDVISSSYIFTINTNNIDLNHTYLIKATNTGDATTGHDLSVAVLTNGINSNEIFDVFWSSSNGDLLDTNSNVLNVGGISSIKHVEFENRVFIIVTEVDKYSTASRFTRVLELTNSVTGTGTSIVQIQTLPAPTGRFDSVEVGIIPTLGNVELPYLFVSNSEDNNGTLTSTQAIVYRWSQTLNGFEVMQSFNNTTSVAGAKQLKPFRYWTGAYYKYYFITRHWSQTDGSSENQFIYEYDYDQDEFSIISNVFSGVNVSDISVFEHCNITYIMVLSQNIVSVGSAIAPILYKWNGTTTVATPTVTFPLATLPTLNVVHERRKAVMFSIDDISPMMIMTDDHGKTRLYKWDGLTFVITDEANYRTPGGSIDYASIHEPSYTSHMIGADYV